MTHEAVNRLCWEIQIALLSLVFRCIAYTFDTAWGDTDLYLRNLSEAISYDTQAYSSFAPNVSCTPPSHTDNLTSMQSDIAFWRDA